jgi:ureidoacrylate peracid hydrolase
MHNYVTPKSIQDRVLKAQGKPHAIDTIDAARAALVTIDMQNHYVAEGFPAEAPVSRAIVPNINRMAAAMRRAGGKVIWIQTTTIGALERWANHHKYKLTEKNAERRLKSLSEDSEGFRLYPELDVLPADLRVRKIKYSAMIPDSSDLHQVLTQNGIDTLVIAGTKTNVCCESTARDASMFEYRVIMLSDGTAAATEEEHAGTLNNFQIYFGDVMTTDEAIARMTVPA